MKLLVILLCLFSERFLIHQVSYQRFFWFTNYYQSIKKSAEKNTFFNNPWALLGLIILPILLASLLIYVLLGSLFFGFVGFIFNLLIFYYCIGPQNVFYPMTQAETEQKELVGLYFFSVNQQLFAPVFWYLVGGPIAIMAYRLVSICQQIDGVAIQSKEVVDLLDWIPARLTSLLFLLVGNFQQGLKSLSQFIFSRPEANHQLLSECGLQAINNSEAEGASMSLAEGLVEHAVIVMLVIIALFTLIAWL